MLKFENVDNKAVATATNGLKVIAHACALNIGVGTPTPLSMEDASVKIYTSLEECDINGEVTGNYAVDSKLTIGCKASDLPNSDIASEEFRDFYIDKLVAKPYAFELSQLKTEKLAEFRSLADAELSELAEDATEQKQAIVDKHTAKAAEIGEAVTIPELEDILWIEVTE